MVLVPQDLEDGFVKSTQQAYPDLSAITLGRGIDAAVFYFNKLTKTPDKTVSSDVKYLVTIIDIMMAIWMLQTVRGSRGYDIAARYPCTTAFERQMDYWGMTLQRFFDQFEKVLPLQT